MKDNTHHAYSTSKGTKSHKHEGKASVASRNGKSLKRSTCRQKIDDFFLSVSNHKVRQIQVCINLQWAV